MAKMVNAQISRIWKCGFESLSRYNTGDSVHRKDIRSLKKQAGQLYRRGKKQEAYALWLKADKEVKENQIKKMKTTT